MASLPNEVKAACKVLGISPSNVMASRVEKDCVVIIEGPVGFKHKVPMAELSKQPAAEEGEPTPKKGKGKK